MQLKINWFPVQVPKSPIKLKARRAAERGDYKAYPNVRQYRYQKQWLAAAVSDGGEPADFEPFDISSEELPQLTSALLLEAFFEHYARQSFLVERGKGQGTVLTVKQVPALPPAIRFYEGVTIKPFHVFQDQTSAFGFVIDYTTHQEFRDTLADDEGQRSLAKQGHEVYARREDGSHRSGLVKSMSGRSATIEWRGEEETVPLSELRLRANYQTVGDYADRSQRGRGRQVIRVLQVESLMLTQTGYMNVNRLSNRYEKVAALLGRNRSANIIFTLPTLCRSVISVATEPADLEVRR